MKSFRSYSFAVLVSVLLAQLSFAQHMTVHFAEHGYTVHAAHDDHDHHHDHSDEQPEQDHARELCDVCILGKSFSLGLAVSNADIPVSAAVAERPLALSSSNKHQRFVASYHARAPPAFLI